MNALEIRDLTKHYTGFSLNHLNLTLPWGCIMGLVGENGAGKSTTIKLILNTISRDGGTVTILGRDNRENLCLSKEEIGVVCWTRWASPPVSPPVRQARSCRAFTAAGTKRSFPTI